MNHVKDQMMGKAKKNMGKISGDKNLEMRGKAQETKGDVKDALHKIS
jgi:uncharacterized protein YjbJ (UPF0337 family)